MKAIHVHTHAEHGWVARREGSERWARRFATKRQALTYARALLSWTEIVVHRTDGTVLCVELPKPIPPPPPPRLKHETLAGRMVKRFTKRRSSD